MRRNQRWMTRRLKPDTSENTHDSFSSFCIWTTFQTHWAKKRSGFQWEGFSKYIYGNNLSNASTIDPVVAIQSLSCIWLFVTPCPAARQASLSITNSWRLLKLMSIKSVMPSNHLILCCPPSPSAFTLSQIRVFSNESALHIRWPKYWSFSFSFSPSNEYSGLISFRMDRLDLLAI